MASWSIEPFDHNRYGPKIGGVPFGEVDRGPHLIQCGQGRGLPARQVSSWSIQPFGHSTPTSQTGQDRQRSDSTGRTVLQTVAQKRILSLLLVLLTAVQRWQKLQLRKVTTKMVNKQTWSEQLNTQNWHIQDARCECITKITWLCKIINCTSLKAVASCKTITSNFQILQF